MDTALLHALSISRSIKNGKLKRERIVGVKKIDRQTCGREGGWRVLGGWGRGCRCVLAVLHPRCSIVSRYIYIYNLYLEIKTFNYEKTSVCMVKRMCDSQQKSQCHPPFY